MIITTNDLNNIETKITTPQINGIEFINFILDEDENVTGINASYNDIMTAIESGKLPVIAGNGPKGKSFYFIAGISFEDPSYAVSLVNDSRFIAENATTNMSCPR